MEAIEVVKQIGEEIGIDWDSVEFTPEDLAKGMEVETEHGSYNSDTNVTNDDPGITAKIAWAHLKELPDYYDRLEQIEQIES